LPIHPSPQFRALSLGAGVQSSTLLALSAEGILPKIDYAIFADTGWEPKSVYDHLDRLEREIATPAGIPVLRVSSGNIRNDALNPDHRFASMPLYILNTDGRPGMTRRQCTGEYKVKPIKKKIRDLLGYPYPTRIPKGVFVEQWIGISTDEFHRAKDAYVKYMQNRHPLIDMGWSRSDCVRYLTSLDLAETPKSSCLGCPFHGNAQWRRIRDNSPAEWEDVVEFEAAIRKGNARANASGNRLLGEAFLHRSRVPLGRAPIDHVTASEWAALQQELADEDELERGVADGCSPWACRGDADALAQDDFGLAT
jgi:3'-phosphoadenosine 5'-phosphosulfate sulfotransferase (PAPS reductase)/FAD synthetase